jgi:tripartite-type tricarboxylate transporter receptor subunit TctC
MVPAGTPKNIIDKIESAGLKALKDESVTQRLIQIGSQPIPSSQIDFNRYFLKDIAHWSKVLSDGKIEKPQ